MTVLELLIPVFMVFMQSRVAKTGHAHHSAPADSPA